jgi:competence protein ComEC
VWHAGGDDARTESEVNDSSLVVWGDASGVTFLALGDLEEGGQRAFASATGAPMASVLKVAHHGSVSQDAGLIGPVARGAVAVISVGADNPYGHPSLDTLGSLESAGAAVFRTDECGDVDVSRREALVVTARCG